MTTTRGTQMPYGRTRAGAGGYTRTEYGMVPTHTLKPRRSRFRYWAVLILQGVAVTIAINAFGILFGVVHFDEGVDEPRQFGHGVFRHDATSCLTRPRLDTMSRMSPSL